MYIDMNCPCKGKNLDKLLQPVILSIIAKHERIHGFAIIKEIEQIPRFENKAPDATGIYRYLKKMESSGLLESEWEICPDNLEKPKRIFCITSTGRECLNYWKIALLEYQDYIKSVIGMISKIVD